MKFDTSEFRKYLQGILDENGIEEYKQQPMWQNILMWFLTFYIVGIPWLIVEWRKHKTYKAKLRPVFPSSEDLYDKFFTMSLKDPKTPIKYNGFTKNNILKEKGTGLSFTINEQEYEYDVHEWVEMRTREVYDSYTNSYQTEEYPVFFYKDATKTYSPKAKDLDKINISNNYKLFKKEKGTKTSYQTESIDFNRRFIAEGINELQLVKLLRPVVIDNFISDPKYKLPGQIEINHGEVYEHCYSGESLADWDMGIVDDKEKFIGLPHVVDATTKKIEKDFNDAFAMLDVMNKLKID